MYVQKNLIFFKIFFLNVHRSTQCLVIVFNRLNNLCKTLAYLVFQAERTGEPVLGKYLEFIYATCILQWYWVMEFCSRNQKAN